MSELSEAAERLSEHADAILNCVTKTEGTHESGGRFTSYDRDVDKPGYGLAEPYELARFVKGFLDPTPLTADWLRSATTPSTLSEAVYGYHLDGMGVSLNLCRDARLRWMATISQDSDSIALGEQKTRGQIRRLCAAIGLELKETRDG